MDIFYGRMNYVRQKAGEAHERFEHLVREVVERELGCGIWQGLVDGRVKCTAGIFYVDGRPTCVTTPVRYEGNSFRFEFQDLTHGGPN